MHRHRGHGCWSGPDPWRNERRRERERERTRREEPQSAAEPADPEARRLRAARLRAEDKLDAASEAVKWSVITILLLIFIPPAGFFVLFFGGMRHFRNLYRLVIEPKLRQRFIDREVERQVDATLSHERQQIAGEHARSMETLSASIAHEIRNPITAAKSLVQQMEEDPTASENVEYARVALEELHRVERSVSHLLRYAREEEMGVGDVRMADVIDSALETFRERIARGGIELERSLEGEGRLRGDAEQLRRVIINLVGNAIDALDESHAQKPRIEVAMGENLAGSHVWVRVKDNGPGVDPEALQKMWSPFYTSKPNGTGLGLAISKKLVDAHHGTLEASSQPGAGAEFLVTLPKQLAGGTRT
jgi:signal transduction histidine kinase